MKLSFVFVFILFHVIFLRGLSGEMDDRTIIHRLGYVPAAKIIKTLSFDQESLVSSLLVNRTTMYFSGFIAPEKNQENRSIKFDEIYQILKVATRLDPYNMDAYYFAQAVLTWDAREIKKVNDLLEYGFKYRTWDWYLPLFLGFNYGYFLKDYPNAAKYYELAGALNGSPLYKSLAGRYMLESGQTEMAIAYMEEMYKTTRHEEVRKAYRKRIEALYGVKIIEESLKLFVERIEKNPSSLNELVECGFLKSLPVDPYGGDFYLTDEGRVRSTSNFAEGYLRNNRETKP